MSQPVEVFHHTLLWPLLMRGGKPADKEHPLAPFVTALERAGWKEEFAADCGVHADYTYEEVVYFHPFVRDFLFGDGKTPKEERAVRRFTRKTSVAALNVTLESGAAPLDLRVERVELFLIRPRVAVLLVEVSNRKPDVEQKPEPTLEDPRTPLSLYQVLLLQSRLRHIYPPYFAGAAHGDCPLSVEWVGLPKPKNANLNCTTAKSDFDTFVRAGAEPPVYDHWRAPFCNEAGEAQIGMMSIASDRDATKPYFQQLLDDRMPGLSFIAVPHPPGIERADEDRLPAFDSPNLDYDGQFNDALRAGFRYTRFRHLGTTYYCNGTSFAAVVNTGWFSNVLLVHFRRHYTHLALLAHYQHAALLYFADELAESAKKERNGPDAEWREEVRGIQHRFLKFRTRSYFTEVSNQIQGKDLFRLWLTHLGTEALFARVSDTCEQVYDALENRELKELAFAQMQLAAAQKQLAEKQADENAEMKELALAQKRLADIAYYGLGLSIAISALSAVFGLAGLYPDRIKENVSFSGDPFVWPWLWSIAGCVPAFLAVLWLRHKKRKIDKQG